MEDGRDGGGELYIPPCCLPDSILDGLCKEELALRNDGELK